MLTFQEGHRDDALESALAALSDLHRLGNAPLTVMAIDFVAAIAAGLAPEESVRLAGAAHALRATLGGGMKPEACGLEDARTAAARTLAPVDVQRAWSRGQELKLEDAIALARTLRPQTSRTSEVP